MNHVRTLNVATAYTQFFTFIGGTDSHLLHQFTVSASSVHLLYSIRNLVFHCNNVIKFKLIEDISITF